MKTAGSTSKIGEKKTKAKVVKQQRISTTILPIIVVVLLACSLTGTYSWFSSFNSVETGVAVNADSYTEITLNSNSLDPNLKAYNGQLGYSDTGVAYTDANAPYVVKFDIDFKAMANKNLDIEVDYKYIEIKVGAVYFNTVAETIKNVFGDPTGDPAAYLASRVVENYESGSVNSYYVDNHGNYVPATSAFKSVEYVPKNAELNSAKKGMIALNVGGGVEYIVLKSAYAYEFFDLQYTYFDKIGTATTPTEGYWQGLDDTKYADTTAFPQGKWLNIAQPLTLHYNQSNEVATDFEQCKKHKIGIKIGYYADKGNGKYSTFIFGGRVFTGSVFSFALRLHGEALV